MATIVGKVFGPFTRNANTWINYWFYPKNGAWQSGQTIDFDTTTLYPIARVSRWLSARANDVRRRLRLDSKSAVLNDLTVRPVINEIFAFLLRQEAPFLRRRVQLPIGTSLLAVARAV